MNNIYFDHIDSLLIELGKWAKYQTIRHGFKMSAIGRLTSKPEEEPNITDEEAQAIDLALSKLKRIDMTSYDAADIIYIKGLSMREAAKKLKTSREQVKAYRYQIVGFVAANLPEALTGGHY